MPVVLRLTDDFALRGRAKNKIAWQLYKFLATPLATLVRRVKMVVPSIRRYKRTTKNSIIFFVSAMRFREKFYRDEALAKLVTGIGRILLAVAGQKDPDGALNLGACYAKADGGFCSLWPGKKTLLIIQT
jgi:hypothetical protein